MRTVRTGSYAPDFLKAFEHTFSFFCTKGKMAIQMNAAEQ